MAFPATLSIVCMCSFGLAPSSIAVAGQTQALAGNLPIATIMDKPTAPFGMCTNPANPAVAAATAAALGVPTPAPCAPVFPGPWMPGAPTVLVANQPCLNNTSKLICAYGGIVQMTAPTVANVQVP